MPAKKIIVKKKGSVVLTPKVMIQDHNSKPGPSQTLHIPDPEDEDALDNSASGAVHLNSSTLRDPVEQRPLNPEQSEPSPKMDLTQDLAEPTFKFYCYRCGQKLKVPVSWAHLSTTCGRCGRDLVVPPPLVGDLG
ncbi:MAG: hypothetical protein ACO3N7_07915 [Kiritimatiellia bacterium]